MEITIEEEEIMIIKLYKGKRPINIMTTYGRQEGGECDAKEEVSHQMNMWEQRIIEMQSKCENIIWIGDLNVKVGNNEQGIEGNHPEITYGGKMLRNLIKKKRTAADKCN